MIAFILATKKEKLLSLLSKSADENNLMVNEAVRNANRRNEATRTSFKMRKKMFGINETKQFKSLKKYELLLK